MASWNEILDYMQKTSPQERAQYLETLMIDSLNKISELRNNRNVIFYASGFLQKPQIDPLSIQITNEDINSFMALLHDMNFSKGLTLILHTPGGITTATETIKKYNNSTDIAKYFNSPELHKSHGKRINRIDCMKQGLNIYELENNQDLQDAVLTAYHAMTILFEQTPASKIVVNNSGKKWIKNIAQPVRMSLGTK